MATPEGEWQDKGVCQITLAMLADHADGVHLVLVPPADLDAPLTITVESNVVFLGSRGGAEAPLRGSAAPREIALRTSPFAELIPQLTAQLPSLSHIAAAHLYTAEDTARINRLDALTRANGLSILATNLPLYHAPHRRPLHDVMTAIRHKTTVAAAGHLLAPNAERHLKSPEDMARLFAPWPHAIDAARGLADSCTFDLEELRYEYPEETCPDGLEPQQQLDRLTWEGAALALSLGRARGGA